MSQSQSTPSFGRSQLYFTVKIILAFVLLVVALVLFALWRDGRFLTGTEGKVAAILREVEKEENRNMGAGGFLERLSYSLPSPLDDVFDRVFSREWKGEYEYVDELTALGTNVVPFLVRSVEFETSLAARRVSANALAELRAMSASPLIARLLRSDNDAQVRLAMAQALRIYGDTNTVPQLLEGLERDSDSDVRVCCGAALGDLRIAAAARLILKELPGVEGWDGRQMLIAALGKLRFEPALPELIRQLQPPPATTNNAAGGSRYYRDYGEQQVRSEAAKALAVIGGDAAREAMIRQLAVEKETNVGEEICDSMASLGGSNVVAALRAQLTPKSEMRQYAARALGQMGDPTVLPELVSLLNDRNDEVRAAAARALGSLGSPSVVDALRRALDVEGADAVTGAICEALIQLGDDSDGARIAKAFGQMKENRNEVIWVLGHLGDTNVIPLLKSQLMAGGDDASRFAAAYELALIGTEQARQAVRENLTDSDDNARHAKACSLLMMGDDAALGTVQKSLRSKAEWQRFGAVMAVDRSGLANRQELLAPRQQDANSAIRRYAASASEGRGLTALVELLQAGDDEYRHYAARALVFYKDTNAIPALKHARTDQNKQVREAARLSVRYLERRAALARAGD